MRLSPAIFFQHQQYFDFDVIFCILPKKIQMGKGDKKTKRGKINRGSYGARRPRIKKKPSIETKISIDKKTKVS